MGVYIKGIFLEYFMSYLSDEILDLDLEIIPVPLESEIAFEKAIQYSANPKLFKEIVLGDIPTPEFLDHVEMILENYENAYHIQELRKFVRCKNCTDWQKNPEFDKDGKESRECINLKHTYSNSALRTTEGHGCTFGCSRQSLDKFMAEKGGEP